MKKIVLAAAALVLASTIGWLVRPTEEPVDLELASNPWAFTDLERGGLSDSRASVSADTSIGTQGEPRSPIDEAASPIARIQVVEADGSPASGIAAAIVDSESSVRAMEADEDGCIHLEPTGERVEVVVGGPDRFPHREIVILEAGIHRIEIAAGRSLSGRVLVGGAPPGDPLVLRVHPSPFAGLDSEGEIARALGCAEYESFSLALQISGDGAFRASGLPKDWNGKLRVPRTYTFPDASPNGFGYQVLELETPVEDLVIEIEKMACLRGRVVEAQGGIPVPGAHVGFNVVWKGGDSTMIGAIADDSGQFEIPLGDRTFRSVRLDELTDATGHGSASQTALQEHLAPFLDLGDVQLERPPSRDVSFVVRDSGGRPIAKAIASADDLTSPPTDGEGRSTLASLPYESKELRVAAHGFWSKVVSIPDPPAGPLDVVLGHGNELAVEIQGIPSDVDGRLWVQLVSQEPLFVNSGNWFPGRIVGEVTVGRYWSAKRGEVNCSCDTSGRLVIEDLRPGVPVLLRVMGGFEAPILETTIPPLGPSERRRVALTFPEPRTLLTGRTLADDGTPLPRVRLSLRRSDQKWDTRMSDRDGLFVFSLREAGEYRIVADRKGWVGMEQPVSVRERVPARVEIRLQPSRHVVVDVVGPRSERLPGVRLEVRQLAGNAAGFPPREDLAGRFHFDELPPVPGVLRVSLAGVEQERPIDPFVPELRVEMPAYGRVEFTCDSACTIAPETNVRPLIVLRSTDSSRGPLTFSNLEELSGEFPVVWPGDYTLGLELYANATAEAPERWAVLRPAVPVHVEADRTVKVSLVP